MSSEGLDRFFGKSKADEKELEKQRLLALIKKHKYGGRGREWHPEFVKYMYMIVEHPDYKGIPWGIDNKGKIRWDAPSHRPPGGKWSNLHDERLEWWKNKAKELGIPLEGKWISEVAEKIHPLKHKPCQTCGREMSLLYEYPTKRTINKINETLDLAAPLDYYDFQSIQNLIPEIVQQCGEAALAQLAGILSIPPELSRNAELFMNYVKDNLIKRMPKGILSPGAMSDAPDRLDGFHSYNLCCRSKQDTGRSAENLMKYGIDRRTFEYWCDGDWAAADFLMNQKVVGKCEECGRETELTADHVGPLSLGFCHRPRFRALCRSCNSARNNRMRYKDVEALKEDERNKATVVSWYAKPIWDMLKDNVTNDSDALLLSKMMRANQHHYLMLIAKLRELGYYKFLATFLHPKYALNRYELVGFDGKSFNYERMKITRRQETYSKSMINRIKRIAFEALEEYGKKGNRNAILFRDKELTGIESALIGFLKHDSTNYAGARKLLNDYMESVACKLSEKGVPRGYWK